MGQPKTTIELNGKLYDASTGAMVQPAAASAPNTPASVGKVVDGFTRRPESIHITKPQAAPKPSTTHQTPTAHHASRKPQHAQTLMRHVVQKPQVVPATQPVSSSITTPKEVLLPASAAQVRQERAAHIAKSSAISRFSSKQNDTPTVSKKVAHLPVRAHPETPQNIAPPIAKASNKASSNSFHKALEHADSHHAAPLKAKKLRHRTAKKMGVSTRVLGIASTALVVVLLTGFVAYQNSPNIAMYLAANQAGFHGSIPGYTPGGFGMSGPIKATPGAITVNFRSHTDNRSYTVTQKPSNWTSDSLRFNFFKATDSPTALLDKGKTIYFYNNGASAAWVNGGVLYQITGDANLNSDQVVSIADSL